MFIVLVFVNYNNRGLLATSVTAGVPRTKVLKLVQIPKWPNLSNINLLLCIMLNLKQQYEHEKETWMHYLLPKPEAMVTSLKNNCNLHSI